MIPTKDPKTPLMVVRTSTLPPVEMYDMTIATKPPAKDADIVVHVAFAARRHLFPVTPKVLKSRFFPSHL